MSKLLTDDLSVSVFVVSSDSPEKQYMYGCWTNDGCRQRSSLFAILAVAILTAVALLHPT